MTDEPASLPTLQEVMTGSRVVSIAEDTEGWLVIELDNRFSVHILCGAVVIAHPDPAACN